MMLGGKFQTAFKFRPPFEVRRIGYTNAVGLCMRMTRGREYE